MFYNSPKHKHSCFAIYRGAGGAGDAVADSSSEALLVRDLANQVEADADAAEAAKLAAQASQTAAANSATSASTSATSAATSATNAITRVRIRLKIFFAANETAKTITAINA